MEYSSVGDYGGHLIQSTTLGKVFIFPSYSTSGQAGTQERKEKDPCREIELPFVYITCPFVSNSYYGTYSLDHLPSMTDKAMVEAF